MLALGAGIFLTLMALLLAIFSLVAAIAGFRDPRCRPVARVGFGLLTATLLAIWALHHNYQPLPVG